MDGRSDRALARRRVNRGMLVGGLLIGVLGLSARSVQASAIRGHHLIVVNSGNALGPAWARFLAGGPSLWATTGPPRFPSDLVLPKTAAGSLVETPFVDYLFWRRRLDIARFNRYHPHIGPALGALVPPSVSSPGGTTTGLTPHPFNPAPQNLPEPGSFAIAFVMFGAAIAWWSRFGGRATARVR